MNYTWNAHGLSDGRMEGRLSVISASDSFGKTTQLIGSWFSPFRLAKIDSRYVTESLTSLHPMLNCPGIAGNLFEGMSVARVGRAHLIRIDITITSISVEFVAIKIFSEHTKPGADSKTR